MKRIALGMVAVLTLAACGGSDDNDSTATQPVGSETPAETEGPAETDPPAGTEAPSETDAPTDDDATSDGVLDVPDEFATITDAVAAAKPGDLILISPGVYNEAVDVTTDEITIRGLDRNEVVLDGEFELDNGIRVLGASGVVVENMTLMNYTGNGVFWTAVDGYRGSYLTAYRNGDYGIYAFDAVNGQIDNSYASGSPDAGFYIGQCYPCNALIDNVTAEHNGLGYSGTDSGGDLYIINSTFNNNRAGVVPNSGSYELCYPERDTILIGNTVFDNNQDDTPAIDVAILAMGNGILVAGGVRNTISRNLVYNHARTGIGLVPFLEEGPNDDLPSRDEWDVSCDEQREQPVADEFPEALIWEPIDNIVTKNVVSDSGEGDLAVAAGDAPTMDLGNCWAGNTFGSTAPADLETLAPCDGEGSGDWTIDTLDVFAWLDVSGTPPSVDYETAVLPPVPVLDNMPDAATAPAAPATDVPYAVDYEAIVVPTAPAG